MPRTARASVGGICYHVINRGNAQHEVFHARGDYQSFVGLIGLACERVSMRVLAYCVMPNHFHLLLWPYSDGDLGRWMQWLLTAHVRRYHRHYRSSGHIWQGRFKAFPIEQDEHLLTVLRYIERNPLRAGLVEHAEDWPWSSLQEWELAQPSSIVHPGTVPRPENWVWWVNQPQTAAELEEVRQSVNRGTPYGSPVWVRRAAIQLGLEASLRPRGRPKKQGESRVKDWRCGLRYGLSVSASFVWQCLTSRTVTQSPAPPHQTVHDLFDHTAFRSLSPSACED
jgi:putative transposase